MGGRVIEGLPWPGGVVVREVAGVVDAAGAGFVGRGEHHSPLRLGAVGEVGENEGVVGVDPVTVDFFECRFAVLSGSGLVGCRGVAEQGLRSEVTSIGVGSNTICKSIYTISLAKNLVSNDRK